MLGVTEQIKELKKVVADQDETIYQLKKKMERMSQINEQCYLQILELEHKIHNYEQITAYSSLLDIM